MPVRTTEEQANYLLSRQVATSSVQGSQTPEIEALAVFEGVCLLLLLNPKAVYYDAFLARSGLIRAIEEEKTLIESMKEAVGDMANPSYSIRDVSSLETAYNALLQIEDLNKINPEHSYFKKYEGAIGDFLNKQVAVSVRSPGSTTMRRPAEEAKIDLLNLYSRLKKSHSEVLDRLYALAVGVENFSNAPLVSLLGLTTVSRVRQDLKSILFLIENGYSPQYARDLVIRIITGRESLKSVGSLPNLSGPLIDTSSLVPNGYLLKARSSEATPTKESLAGPFILATSDFMSIASSSGTVSSLRVPQASISLVGKPFMVGEQVSYPVTIQPDYYLLLQLRSPVFVAGWTLSGDNYLKNIIVPLNPSPSPVALSLSTVLSLISSAMGSEGAAVEFCTAGSGRILIYANNGVEISVRSSLVDIEVQSTTWSEVGGSHSTDVSSLVYYTLSAHDQLGFTEQQIGTKELTSTVLLDVLNLQFSSVTEFASTLLGGVSVSGKKSDVGEFLTITSPTEIGLACTNLKATSSSLLLYGNGPEGEVLDPYTETPIDPRPFLAIGDYLLTSRGDPRVVAGLSSTEIRLDSGIVMFDGNITVTSAVAVAYREFNQVFQPAVDVWLTSKYHENLSFLDRSLSALLGFPTLARRNDSIEVLSDLKMSLEKLAVILEDTATLLADGEGRHEKEVMESIISTFTERKFDRAIDMLLRCKLYEVLELTYETASHGGSVLKALSDIARSDIDFPDPDANDEIQTARVSPIGDKTGGG